jgi:hypothetical protein
LFRMVSFVVGNHDWRNVRRKIKWQQDKRSLTCYHNYKMLADEIISKKNIERQVYSGLS